MISILSLCSQLYSANQCCQLFHFSLSQAAVNRSKITNTNWGNSGNNPKYQEKNIKCMIFSPWQRCCNALLEQKKKQRNIKTRCNDEAHPRCHSMTVIVKTSSFFDATKESWSVISDYVLHIFIPNNTLNHKTCSMKILNWSPCVTTTT